MSDENTILPKMGFATLLDEEDRVRLGGFGEFLDLTEGDVLIEEGVEQGSLFLIIFGSFHVQTNTTGQNVLLGSLKSGDGVGEINIFDPGKASASVVSRSVSQVWKIERPQLEQYLETHPNAATRVMVSVATQLSKRLRKTNEKVAMARFDVSF